MLERRREKDKIEVDALVKRAEAMRSPNYSYQTTVTIQDYKGKKESGKPRVYLSKIDPSHGALVEFMKPNTDAGKKMLMVKDNMWLKFPKAANPMRVTPRQKLIGQASNGDIVSISYIENYDAEYVELVKEAGKELHRIKLTAKPDKLVSYHVIDYFVEAKTGRPSRAVYKTKSGRELRTGHYGDYQSIEGNQYPTKIEIESALKKDLRTEIVFSGYEKKSFSKMIFNRSYLDR